MHGRGRNLELETFLKLPITGQFLQISRRIRARIEDHVILYSDHSPMTHEHDTLTGLLKKSDSLIKPSGADWRLDQAIGISMSSTYELHRVTGP